ncbi:MAG: undecaprenyldiphospho-muramoylpentapeptide beta-N-acetylglucosaminyltransferase [Patescibacteria group bacterium]|jgi:UDP-N-acetylglucosamine--N-acetylmuramyl-(pentapeptide) pyrophosphoryl-undecaprenol N-acetylglucosamine transferase|nr:undecaprenyldiphospho-muramoylpentapeptide beta-N-acetylglucosaminyltransferase [Patescibacteria group bacterium]
MKKRIVLAGGGTGGHLFPLTTVAKYLKENYKSENGLEFLFIGPKGEFEDRLMKEHNIPQKNIQCGKMRRYFSFHYFFDLFKLPIGFFQSLWHLFSFMPDVVFAKGGFASVPVVLAAWIYRIPVILHESDAVPGMANKFLGATATLVALNFERAKMYFNPKKTFMAGLPIRESVINGNKEKARKFLSMEKETKPVVLFLGGSQGAESINSKVVEVVDVLIDKYQIVHQTGTRQFEKITKKIQHKGYKIEHSDYYPIDFIGEELGDLLALADVVVSRAGATSIAEIAANAKPVILVPIKNSANTHQRINAFEISKARAGVVLEEQNFSKGTLMHYLMEIEKDKEFKETLSSNIKNFYSPDSTQTISEAILRIMR